ncbi:MAG: hypothetical protein ABI986_13895 [Chloroflexota bacterium]
MSGKYFDTNSKVANWSPAVLDTSTREKLWSVVARIPKLDE